MPQGTTTATDDAQALRELEAVGLDLPPGLELSWLGVSGYRLTYEGVSLFIDPYVSRVPLRSLLLRRLAMPDEAMIDRYASAPGVVAGGRRQAKWINLRDIQNAGTPEWRTRMDFTLIGKEGQMAKGFRMEWTTVSSQNPKNK